jgi:hypothetical protein
MYYGAPDRRKDTLLEKAEHAAAKSAELEEQLRGLCSSNSTWNR